MDNTVTARHRTSVSVSVNGNHVTVDSTDAGGARRDEATWSHYHWGSPSRRAGTSNTVQRADRDGAAASLESGAVSLEDRDALAVLRDAFEPDDRATGELVRRFYTHWFAFEASVRDLFPPEMDTQRAAFAHALHWVYGELVEQRAEEPVVISCPARPRSPQVRRAARRITTRCGARCIRRCARTSASLDRCRRGAATQSLNLITGVMSGAADAEDGPAWWDGTVIEHIGSRVISRWSGCSWTDRCSTTPVSTSMSQVPQCPRRWRYLSPAIPPDADGAVEFHVRAVPGGLVSNADRQRNAARRSLAVVQPARRPAGRPRRRRRADGGGQHRPGAAALDRMDLSR